MNVTAIMSCIRCDATERHYNDENGIGGNIEMRPMYDADDEITKQYAAATPSGKLELSIDNPSAFSFFVPGKSYLVTISER